MRATLSEDAFKAKHFAVYHTLYAEDVRLLDVDLTQHPIDRRVTQSTGSRTPSFQGEFDEWELECDTRHEILQFMPVDADQEQECTCAECEALLAPGGSAPAGQHE